MSGEALADKMLGFVTDHLDPSKLRGQAYDGASNMSGKRNGAAARISSVHPLALLCALKAQVSTLTSLICISDVTRKPFNIST